MLPVIPQAVNRFIQDQNGNLSTYPFPPNLASALTKEQRQKIFQWMLTNYIWPQIMERRPFEATWDKLLSMARATWAYKDTDIDEGTRLHRAAQSRILDSSGDPAGSDQPNLATKLKIADTVIFDAVDRLTNLNHFISYKEAMPVRYEVPEDMVFPMDNDVYSPMSGLVRAQNAWLRFNFQQQQIYRKHWMAARHHYTYGVSFAESQFIQKIEQVPRRMPNRQFQNQLELTDIGITYEPISIRKLWLNWRLPVYRMDHQPCPFLFEEMPRFAIVANQYDPNMNPMGYSNTETMTKGEWLFSSSETESLLKAYQSAYPDNKTNLAQLLAPEYSTELKWTFYPMLPIASVPSEVEGEPDELYIGEMPDPTDPTKMRPIPLQRFIVETFGGNLVNGNQEIIRLQRNFYPHDSVPIYGSAHMPSLDDGVYSPAIGTILEGHYSQICKALLQFIENRDWCNDPPATIMNSSPALTHPNINVKGARIPVNSHNDIVRREPYDGTGTTVQFLEYAEDKAKTSSKSTDAILGKAMGSRTTASEAQNVFQTAMSGVTTDVNLFNHDHMGGYAERVWEYSSLWVDPDILAAITGTYGFAIKPEHMLIRLGLKWDTGSQFIESITRQNNIQYLLQTNPPGSTDVNRPYLIEELCREWRFRNVKRIVNDGGREQQILLAQEQAIRTYLGEQVQVDPEQDHQIAIKVKKSFLQDRDSVWNSRPETVVYGPAIVQQIQLHGYFLQLQMLQMQVQQQQMLMMSDPSSLQPLQNPNAPQPSPGSVPENPGQARSQRGR